MRSANIAQLRDRLTQYLREVRAGEEIIIRDRQRPIAKIVPLTEHADADDAAQLAAALVWCRERPQRRPFICFDERLAKAAAAAGFEVRQ